MNQVAAATGALALIAGTAGGIGRTGIFFVPAPAALAVSAGKLWREQP